ncbi:hypothetical protein IM543_01005 [Massilia sp. UMI-21]|nr:hypothetical protein IM543_01005 [Massilia sp. UMI-21]
MKRLALAVLAAVAAAAPAAAQAQPLRDPFVRPALPAPAQQGTVADAMPETPPRLRAIVLAPGRSLANIDGQILAVGNWFGDYRVIRIQERAVTLLRRGVTSVLELDEAGRK